MRFQSALIVCFFFHFHSAAGQAGDYTLGAKSAAAGDASLTYSDPFSIYNNPAGMAGLASASVFASYENRFLVEDMQVLGAGVLVPVRNFAGGAGFYRFGGKLYSEQMISLKAAHKIGFIAFGAGVNYVQYNIESIGTRGVVVADLGGIAAISDQVKAGAHVYNLTQTKLIKQSGERVPTVMKLGLSYQPVTNCTLSMETLKDVDYAADFRAGIEYYVIPQLALRTGFSTSPFIPGFGCGFRPKKFTVDYSYRNDATLGDMHQISISYAPHRQD